MTDIVIEHLNHTHCRIVTSESIAQELYEHFTFKVPGFQYSPAFKKGFWDGAIHLFKPGRQIIYAGLIRQIEKFARDHEYSVQSPGLSVDMPSEPQISSWVHDLKLPGITPHDYQIDALRASIAQQRALIISATGSGKSLLLYLIFRWFKKKTLVIVPTTSLVHQLAGDIRDYGYADPIHMIYQGQSKDTDALITLSTWQSIYEQPKEWFRQFECVIGDEAHLFKANSLTGILEKMDHCPLRFGLTGTLSETKTNAMVLEGLFGPIFQATSSRELMDRGILSELEIQTLLLKYGAETCKSNKSLTYQDEIEFLVNHGGRNALIANLASKVKGNTLVLFQLVEKHGKHLHDLIARNTDRPVYFISGETNALERDRIRKDIEKRNDVILIASVGTTSTGVNIKSLRNIIFASPTKSKIRTLQSIGRVLRTSENKYKATLFDLADDLSWKTRKNYTLKHFERRLEIYVQENFAYRIRNINLEK